jgi:hypothetical protein
MSSKTQTQSINVAGEIVSFSDGFRYLGVYLDSRLNLKEHVQRKVKVAAGNIRKISCIRKYIDLDTAKLLATSLVLTHLDYSNSVLSGLPQSTLNKLQRVQNWAAKVVLCRTKYDSASDALKTLHWLPIKHRIDFKIACLVHKSLHGAAPTYLSDLLNVRTFSRATRMQGNSGVILEVPFTRKKFADRAFSVYGPKLWNSLPDYLRSIEDFAYFKKQLKTVLFKDAFNII